VLSRQRNVRAIAGGWPHRIRYDLVNVHASGVCGDSGARWGANLRVLATGVYSSRENHLPISPEPLRGNERASFGAGGEHAPVRRSPH